MLIVGLGNPGERYEWTRHNLGFMLVDLVARQSNAQVKRAGLKPASDLVVVSDDIALPFGSIRLRRGGSSGGQKGLKNIISTLGTDEFPRLRVGIKPEHPVGDTAGFVLERFPKGQREEVEQILGRCAEALRAVIRDGLEKAMSMYN